MALALLSLAVAAAVAGAERAVPSTVPCSAADCKEVGQLCAWKVSQMHQAVSFAPGPYQQFSLSSVQEAFVRRLAELEGASPGAPPDPCPIDDLAALARMPRPPPCVGPSGAPLLGGLAQEAAAGGAMDRRQYLAQIEVAKCAKLTQQAWSGRAGRPSMQVPVLLATADMCGAAAQLKEWHVCQFAEIEVHVPRAYRESVAKAVERQFGRRLAQLAGSRDLSLLDEPQEEALPVILMGAAQCPSAGELDAWRSTKAAEIRNIVPLDFQPLALGALDHAFRGRLSALEAQRSLAAETSPAAAGSRTSAALLVLAGLLLPAAMSMAASAGGRSARGAACREDAGPPQDYLLQEAC